MFQFSGFYQKFLSAAFHWDSRNLKYYKLCDGVEWMCSTIRVLLLKDIGITVYKVVISIKLEARNCFDKRTLRWELLLTFEHWLKFEQWAAMFIWGSSWVVMTNKYLMRCKELFLHENIEWDHVKPSASAFTFVQPKYGL